MKSEDSKIEIWTQALLMLGLCCISAPGAFFYPADSNKHLPLHLDDF